MTRLLRLRGNHHGRDGKDYRPSDALRAAADTALLLKAPLLLAGEPGCGKTDFAWYAARALAQALGRDNPENEEPLTCYVRSDMRARDLLSSYDGLARFADAHATGQGQKAMDARRHIALQPLGLGLMSALRRVVLIDEIDKAPRDLPNDILRETDEGHFSIPEAPVDASEEFPDRWALENWQERIYLRREMRRPTDVDKPLVIVTSNAERQLPDAFLRRCVYCYIKFPTRDEMLTILNDRFSGKDALPLPLPRGMTLPDAADVALVLRQDSLRLVKKPGTAEILGWFTALRDLGRAGDWEDQSGLSGLFEVFQALKSGSGRAPWPRLPGLHCLVKLREDLETLERLAPKST